MGATLEALIAAVCRLDKSLSCCWEKGWFVGAVGIELLEALKMRKLLILRNSKREKNRKNTKPRYTRGTRGPNQWASLSRLFCKLLKSMCSQHVFNVN